MYHAAEAARTVHSGPEAPAYERPRPPEGAQRAEKRDILGSESELNVL